MRKEELVESPAGIESWFTEGVIMVVFVVMVILVPIPVRTDRLGSTNHFSAILLRIGPSDLRNT